MSHLKVSPLTDGDQYACGHKKSTNRKSCYCGMTWKERESDDLYHESYGDIYWL